jgi:hypothetical protein
MAVTLEAARIKELVRARLLRSNEQPLEGLPIPERRVHVRRTVMEVLREERAILPTRSLTEVVN